MLDSLPMSQTRVGIESSKIANSVGNVRSSCGGQLHQIANKDTLLHMRAKAFSLILLYVHIRSAAPHSKVRHIRLGASPQLIRCTTLDSICRASVPHMVFRLHLEMTVNAQSYCVSK